MRNHLPCCNLGLFVVCGVLILTESAGGEEPHPFRHLATLPLEDVPEGYHETARYVTFSPDGKILAVTGYERPVQLLEMPSGKLLREIKKERGGTGIGFSPKGDLLACGRMLWNLQSGEHKTIGTAESFANMNAFSREGNLIVLGARRSDIHVWNLATNEKVADLDPFEGAGRIDTGLYKPMPLSFSFSPGAKLLATSIDYWDDELPNFQLVQVWNLDTKELHGAFRGKYCWFSPDAETLIFGAEGKIVLKKTASLEVIATLRDSRDIVPLALSRDGQFIAATSDKTIEIWHLPTRKLLGTMTGHKRTICSADFSPDGTLLATSDWEGTIRLWTSAAG